MEIKHGKGKTEYGPGVDVSLSGNEVATAIAAYLVAHGVYVRGPRTITVNGELISEGGVYVDPSGSVIFEGERVSGRGDNVTDESFERSDEMSPKEFKPMSYAESVEALKPQGERVSGKSGRSGSPDYTLIANRIRILALGCKSKDSFSCEFGNEFTPKVEDCLRECFPAPVARRSGMIRCLKTQCYWNLDEKCNYAEEGCIWRIIPGDDARADSREAVSGRSIGSPAERSEAGNHAETVGKPPFSGELRSPENATHEARSKTGDEL